MLALVNLFLNSKEYHQTTVNNAREHNAHGEALKKKQESGGKLSPNEQQFMSVYRVWDEPTYETFLESLYKVVPPTILQQTGKDSQAIARYLHDNKGYIVPGGGPLMSLDPDAKALGIPNNDVRILEKCISLLESGQQQDLALRVLKRYTEVEFATPAEWKKWLTTNRSKLFFSDMGGFKFFLNVTPSAPVAAMPEPTTANPTVWQAALDTQGPVKPGSTVNLTVRLRLAAGWHVYGDVPKGSPFIPTSFVAKLPKGLTFEGTWEYPKLTAYDAQTSIIQGDVEFKRSIKIGAGVKGKMKVPLTMSWQSCDASKCLPPTQKTLTIEIAVD